MGGGEGMLMLLLVHIFWDIHFSDFQVYRSYILRNWDKIGKPANFLSD